MFKTGDVVQVKSGGPVMTVVAEGEQVQCLWFAEGSETFQRDTFPAACLEAVEFEDETESEEEDED